MHPYLHFEYQRCEFDCASHGQSVVRCFNTRWITEKMMHTHSFVKHSTVDR